MTGTLAPQEPFPGKIAIITNIPDGQEEEYRSAEQLIAKYGKDKIIHKTWPVDFVREQEQMVDIVAQLAADSDIRAIIINQALMGTNAAIDKLLEVRSDMFIAYCMPAEDSAEVSVRSNLVLIPDEVGMGSAMVEQAHAMGATKFIHYSFPRHMSMPVLAARREEIEKTCTELGMEYIDLTAPDPTGDVGVPGARQFILVDVPKKVAEYGKDTAFFATNCAMQIPLIKMVMETGAIYPQPCCPSPYHGFTNVLEIENNYYDVSVVIAETKGIIAEKNMTGRISTWPVSASMMFTNAGVEYAIKWLNGEVPKNGIDGKIIKQCMEDYAGVECFIRTYVDEDGTEYPNFLLVREDYLTY